MDCKGWRKLIPFLGNDEWSTRETGSSQHLHHPPAQQPGGATPAGEERGAWDFGDFISLLSA